MTPNNLCRSLIAYGSYAPGGERHHAFAHLPGTWRRGKIVGSLIEPPDGIGPGEADVIEAWLIEFADCTAALFAPEFEAQERLLHDRWTALDAAMEATCARHQARWWPEHCVPVVHTTNMLVVNIYLPRAYHPWLANRYDVPHPDDRRNLGKLWHEVKRGDKRYDQSHFLALIKDARPGAFLDLFGDLPQGDAFIARLKRLFADHELSPGNLLSDGGTDFHLYVMPLARNALRPKQLVEFARADVAQRATLLRNEGLAAEAEALSRLRFALRRPEPAASGSEHSAAARALEIAGDRLLEATIADCYWLSCLGEACYGIAADYNLRAWLMASWSGGMIDLEPSYALWMGGGRYEVSGDTCCVYEAERRK